jgi:hypothetical protein
VQHPDNAASELQGIVSMPPAPKSKPAITPTKPDLHVYQERAELAEFRAREAEAIVRRLEAEKKIREIQAKPATE